MPEKSDPIAHNGKQNVLVYHICQNLLKFLQGEQVLLAEEQAPPPFSAVFARWVNGRNDMPDNSGTIFIKTVS